MADQVKIGGDSKELIDAIDRAEARFDRFDKAINSRRAPDFSNYFGDRGIESGKVIGRQITDTTARLTEQASVVRRAAVDWGRLAEQRARATAFVEGKIQSPDESLEPPPRPPRPPKKYRVFREKNFDGSIIAQEEEERLAEYARARAEMARRLGGGGRNGSPRGPQPGRGREGAGNLINRATGTTGAESSLSALGVLGVGLGPAIAITATVAAVKKLHDAYKEAEQSVRAFNKEASQKPTGVVANLGQSGILEQIIREKDLAKKARAALGAVDSDSSLGDRVLSPVRKSNDIGGAKRASLGRTEKERREELENALVQRGAANVDIARENASGSQRTAALKQAELETEEKIAKIQLDRNISNRAKAPLIAQANEQLEIQKQKINATADAQERQQSLELRLNELRAEGGRETDVTYTKLLAAQDAYNAAQGDGKKAAEVNLAIAKTDYDLALRKQQLAESSIRVAEFRGSKEAEVKFALQEQLANAEKILNAEERRLAVAQARKAIEENTLAVSLSQISNRSSIDQSTIRRNAVEKSVDLSPDAAQRAQLQAERDAANAALKAASDRVEAEKNAHGDASDEAVVAQIEAGNKQRETAAALLKFEKDTAFAHKQTLNAAKAVTAEMSARARGAEFEARQSELTAKYQQQIAQAIRDGRLDLVQQLQLQQAIDQQLLKRQKFLAGGDEGERNRARATSQANESIDQRIADEEDRKARGAYTRSPDAYDRHPDAYVGPGRSDRRKSDDDFHNQFQRRDVLRDHEQGKREDSAKSDEKEVKGENVLTTKIDALITTLNTKLEVA
ncbi:MAG TPA: hypothetical protein VJS88_00385 [Chthoniobacterales bacterium]|nr:hypothetical protein [Chthoniobacterales bacterium]